MLQGNCHHVCGRFLVVYCYSLDLKYPSKTRVLNIWSPVSGTIWGGDRTFKGGILGGRYTSLEAGFEGHTQILGAGLWGLYPALGGCCVFSASWSAVM